MQELYLLLIIFQIEFFKLFSFILNYLPISLQLSSLLLGEIALLPIPALSLILQLIFEKLVFLGEIFDSFFITPIWGELIIFRLKTFIVRFWIIHAIVCLPQHDYLLFQRTVLSLQTFNYLLFLFHNF